MPSNSKNIAELLNNQTTITADDLASTLDLSSKTLTVPANAVTTHVTQTDLTPVKQDLALLAFDQIRADNRTILNMPNSFVDQYEDSTGIDSLSSCARSNDEKISSYNYGQKGFDEVGVEMLPGKPNMTQQHGMLGMHIVQTGQTIQFLAQLLLTILTVLLIIFLIYQQTFKSMFMPK